MAWKRSLKTRVNSTLRRATGYELQPVRPAPKPKKRPPPEIELAPMPPEVRLLTAPVFIISSIRSGSTLLRAVLGSHSQLHAPHELHLSRLDVRLRSRNARNAMAAIGLDEAGLEQMLWDRLLDRQLRLSGKATVVNKTPSDAFIWRRIAATWPDARFVFLLRHPLSIARSRQAAYPKDPLERHIARTLTFMTAVEEARQALPGLTVRYEDLTEDPEAVTRQLCEFLGVPWEPGMIDYGSRTRGEFVKGLGDWTDRIRSGTVQPARPLPSPDEVPLSLTEISRAWGYLPEPD
jgi:hypothetical protein